MDRRRPRAPKLVVSLRKVIEGPLRLRKERSKVSGLREVVERDPAWSVPIEQLKFPQTET